MIIRSKHSRKKLAAMILQSGFWRRTCQRSKMHDMEFVLNGICLVIAIMLVFFVG
jgi:hypothetical protein